MITLAEKSLETLELSAVLKMLADEAVSDEAKEKCLSLLPSTDIDEVRLLLDKTSAARDMIAINGSPPLNGTKDMSGAVARAVAGGILSVRELLDIAALLHVARLTKIYLDGSKISEKKSCIHYLFNMLTPDKYLEERIFSIILSEEEIADTASPELAAIRRQMRLCANKIRETLQGIITSQRFSKTLQEAIITMRGERYVVPVKVEHRGDLPGLVHDVSSSGSTLFVEPNQVVELNNQLRELAAREKREIERILFELSAEAAQHEENIRRNFEILREIDVIFAKARLSFNMEAMHPEINGEGRIRLVKARHPLLDKDTAVPISVSLGEDYDTLVITGPNTGGKTVALKTIGLLTLMAACGLHIPAAHGSEVSVFDYVLADIGDEQSIEQSLSTFSSHMKKIVSILEVADNRSLCLFDELGAGTDPVEGAALAVAIIQHSRSMGAKTVATTHYAELKTYAMTTPGVENASCEFDVETLKPTYRLITGIPGRSNAFAISAKLGLPDYIIAQAREQVDSGSRKLEDVLAGLEEKRKIYEAEIENLRNLRMQAEKDAREAKELRSMLEKRQETAVENAKQQARRIINDARAAADELFAEMDRIRRESEKKDNWQELNAARAEIKRRLNAAEKSFASRIKLEIPRQKESREIKEGDRVRLLSLGTTATVISSSGKDGMLTLQAGIMKINARRDEVALIEEPEEEPAKKYLNRTPQELKMVSLKTEVDLRGLNADEALMEMDRFLDNALLANLNVVSIIHGKGSGVLKNAVQKSLAKNKAVKSYRLGSYGEGEDGVTIVEFK